MAAGGRSRGAKRRREVEEATAVKLARIRAWKFAAGCAAVPLTVLAMTPVAAQLAGENTRLNVNIVLSLTVGLTVAWGLTGAAYAKQKKRADRLSTRNEQLQLDVAREQGSVDVLEKRGNSLQKDIDRLQSVVGAASSSVATHGKEGQTG